MYKSYLENSNFSTYSEKKVSLKSMINKKARILLSNNVFVNGSQVVCAIIATVGVML